MSCQSFFEIKWPKNKPGASLRFHFRHGASLRFPLILGSSRFLARKIERNFLSHKIKHHTTLCHGTNHTQYCQAGPVLAVSSLQYRRSPLSRFSGNENDENGSFKSGETDIVFDETILKWTRLPFRSSMKTAKNS